MTIQSNNNNLNYLIDPTFTKVNRLFVLPFEGIDENDVKKEILSSHYYVPNIEKGFNVLTDGKSSFAFPVKNEEKAYENIIEMSRNNDCTTDNSLDFAYLKENYRLIAFNLNNETKLKDPQKFILLAALNDKTMEQQCFLSLKNQSKLLLNFYNILHTSHTQ